MILYNRDRNLLGQTWNIDLISKVYQIKINKNTRKFHLWILYIRSQDLRCQISLLWRKGTSFFTIGTFSFILLLCFIKLLVLENRKTNKKSDTSFTLRYEECIVFYVGYLFSFLWKPFSEPIHLQSYTKSHTILGRVSLIILNKYIGILRRSRDQFEILPSTEEWMKT